MNKQENNEKFLKHLDVFGLFITMEDIKGDEGTYEQNDEFCEAYVNWKNGKIYEVHITTYDQHQHLAESTEERECHILDEGTFNIDNIEELEYFDMDSEDSDYLNDDCDCYDEEYYE